MLKISGRATLIALYFTINKVQSAGQGSRGTTTIFASYLNFLIETRCRIS